MTKSLLMMACCLAMLPAFAQADDDPAGKPERTEVWKPEPATVATPPGAAPSDAIVLFDGHDLSAWESEQGGPAGWHVADGVATVVPGGKGIRTKQSFCDIQLHVEWRTPTQTRGFDGQARGNSGIFLQELYELQVLDNYKNETYVNGMVGSLYKQAIPLANAARKPGEWETYDVAWTAPVFDAEGKVVRPAYVTVLFNGVLVENHFELQGETLYIGKPFYKAYDRAPIKLQAHGDKSEPISFRNIWVRELP